MVIKRTFTYKSTHSTVYIYSQRALYQAALLWSNSSLVVGLRNNGRSTGATVKPKGRFGFLFSDVLLVLLKTMTVSAKMADPWLLVDTARTWKEAGDDMLHGLGYILHVSRIAVTFMVATKGSRIIKHTS